TPPTSTQSSRALDTWGIELPVPVPAPVSVPAPAPTTAPDPVPSLLQPAGGDPPSNESPGHSTVLLNFNYLTNDSVERND
ncbi:MAG TPA: hypothetical protein PLS96_12390, partial [Myxococcota bacterium]|nr:hypothetical protein [Myxococcota bacterium]HQE74760.1 hypothetical protein [Myxococcota bacterium]